MRFLLEANKYLALLSSDNVPSAKMLQNRVLIDMYFLKLALKFEERTRRGKKISQLDKYRKDAESKIKNYAMTAKNIKEKDNQLM